MKVIEEVMPHQGNNVRFFREAKHIKQEDFAKMLDMAQSSITKIERRDIIDDELLDKCAVILGVSAETLKEFDSEKLLHNITYNIETAENVGGNYGENYFNPIEKIMELNKQNTELYERMLKVEQEKNAMLEKMVAELKGK